MRVSFFTRKWPGLPRRMLKLAARSSLGSRRRLQPVYAKLFLGLDDQPHPNAAIVLADLRRFCGVDRERLVVSPVSRQTDAYASFYLAGKQAVYTMIERMLSEELPEGEDDGGRSINQ